MSFLAGRLAGKEAAYFFQESKQAVNRIAEKSPSAAAKPSSTQLTTPESQADVLPEVLRHSLPSYIFGKPSDPSSLSIASKWTLPSDPNKPLSVSSDALESSSSLCLFLRSHLAPKGNASGLVFPN